MVSEAKVIGFAATVCVVCSLTLSGVYSALKERQDINKAIDLKGKVLQAFGIEVTNDKGKYLLTPDEVQTMFAERVEGLVIDRDAKMAADVAVADLTKEDINDRDADGLKRYYPYYVYTDPDTSTKLYAIHVSGMGLWSVVKGYLALESDLGTIAGLAVYDHAETPGLGGDVDQPWFLKQFSGKKLVKTGKVQHFRVLKPSEVADDSSVNGPSGATMTSNGMTKFINSDFSVYHKHFNSLKGG